MRALMMAEPDRFAKSKGANMLARKQRAAETAAPDPLASFHALAARINAIRAELDEYLNEYARLVALGNPGVPAVNIRMTLDAGSRCFCAVATKVLAQQVADLELQRREAEK